MPPKSPTGDGDSSYSWRPPRSWAPPPPVTAPASSLALRQREIPEKAKFRPDLQSLIQRLRGSGSTTRLVWGAMKGALDPSMIVPRGTTPHRTTIVVRDAADVRRTDLAVQHVDDACRIDRNYPSLERRPDAIMPRVVPLDRLEATLVGEPNNALLFDTQAVMSLLEEASKEIQQIAAESAEWKQERDALRIRVAELERALASNGQ